MKWYPIATKVASRYGDLSAASEWPGAMAIFAGSSWPSRKQSLWELNQVPIQLLTHQGERFLISSYFLYPWGWKKWKKLVTNAESMSTTTSWRLGSCGTTWGTGGSTFYVLNWFVLFAVHGCWSKPSRPWQPRNSLFEQLQQTGILFCEFCELHIVAPDFTMAPRFSP